MIGTRIITVLLGEVAEHSAQPCPGAWDTAEAAAAFEADILGRQMSTVFNQYNQKFGKYEILEELGRGGMGVVYKARDPIIGRLVALKTLASGLASNPEVLKRFYREAQAAGRLQHPNIITIFDMGEVESTPYIAMAFLEGKTLEKVIADRESLPVAQKLSIILQLCRGLDFAHKNGVVHRDVKPGNVFLGKDGIVRVLDFGIVHIAATTMTSTGMVIGTVPYMSPEQVTGQRVDQRSDIFSVGTVSYELLTYTRPFDGPNFPAIMYKIVKERPVLPGSLVPGIPPELEQAVMRCLEPRLEDRFQSLEDFVLEMEPLEQSLKRQMIGNLVGQGQEFYNCKEYSKAKEVLRDVLLLDSNHGLAKELMAKVNSELRRAELAIRAERLVEDGSHLLEQGNPAEAAKVLEEALGLNPDHGPARSLLEEARQRMEREKLLREGLAAVRSAIDRGTLTVAEAALAKVLQLDAYSSEAQALQNRIKEARAHQRQLRIKERVLIPKRLLADERYEEAIRQLDQLAREFPGEAEIEELLRTAHTRYEKRERRRQLEAQAALAKGLIADRRFQEAVDLLDKLLAKTHSPELVLLRDSARQSMELAAREQLERELASVQELIRQEKYDTAVERAQVLSQMHPNSGEVRRVLEFARDRKAKVSAQLEEERLKRQRVGAACQTITNLLDSGDADRALQEAIQALDEFPGNADLTALWMTAERGIKERAVNRQREMEELRQAAEAPVPAPEGATAIVHAGAPPESGEMLVPPVSDVPPAAPVAPLATEPLDSSPYPVVQFWKRRTFQIAAAGAAALLVIVALTWKAFNHKPPKPLEPSHPAPTAEQRALEMEAQDYESQHRLQSALNIWQKLQAEPGPLQKEAAEAARRDQEKAGQAETFYNHGKSAARLGTRQSYETAKGDYLQAGEINADLKPQADQAIQEVNQLMAGRTAAQIEQQSYSKAQELWKAHQYPEAKAALLAIVEQNLPGSKLVKQAQIQLKQIDGLIQDQQKFEDAKAAFSAQQYDKAQPEFQDLANGNTEWKAQAQDYLRQIHDIRTAAQQAAAKAAIKAAEEKVQEKIAAKRYGEASALLPEVESAGGNPDSLRTTIEENLHAELNGYKQEAAGNPTDAGLKHVLAEVQDLARRAGPLNKDATDYELTLQNQLDRLKQASVTPPPAPAPPPPAPTTLRPTITTVVRAERAWTDRIQDEMVVPAEFVRGGLHFAAKPALPDNVNDRAHKGDEVDLNCTVDANGEVKSCSPTATTDFANLVAAAARSWKFRGPLLLDQSNSHASKAPVDQRVSARVPITVSY